MCDFFTRENKFLELYKKMQRAALENQQWVFEEEIKPDIIVESKDEVAVSNNGSQCDKAYSR
jgi:hypothetical protein